VVRIGLWEWLRSVQIFKAILKGSDFVIQATCLLVKKKQSRLLFICPYSEHFLDEFRTMTLMRYTSYEQDACILPDWGGLREGDGENGQRGYNCPPE
jgi:hypothetical protein